MQLPPLLVAECTSHNGLLPLGVCVIINPENNKESIGIKSSDAKPGWSYNDYLATDEIPKRLFVRQ